MKDKIKVLYIDDEDNNLNSFRAGLRKDFNIFTTVDPKEGLDMAEETDFQVVIADQRMPGMTGVEFFEKLVKIKPEPIRILLTGYSDIASAINAINIGEVYRFIDKPWNIEQVRNAIINAADLYYTRRELREKTEKLSKVNAEMNVFIHSLTHNLRGPLSNISATSKLAKSEIDDRDILEYFDLIDTATANLDDFFHKILDFYRTTRMENEVVAITFEEVMKEQMDAYRSKWDLANIDFSIHVDQQEQFFSDDGKIRVILNNLISNAVNYQKEDGGDKKIEISIVVKEGFAHLKVLDNGVGIEPDKQEGVFNLYNPATQKTMGSGLGLYMVKGSVEQLKGTIRLTSRPGEGTEIEISLMNLAK